jgi:hypothetical protein
MSTTAARKRPPRVWNPRPSAAARARILGAIGALTADGWTSGYGVRLADLACLLAPAMARQTLLCYLSSLVAAGDLRRPRIGLYTLPAGSMPSAG